MLKKAGLLTVGVTASLLAVAPIASAGESSHEKGDNDKESSHDSDHGKKHHKHGDDDKHHGKKHHKSEKATQSCDSTGGNAEAGSGIDGDSLANVVTQAPLGGASVGSIASCNKDFLNDNFSGNKIAIASGII